MVIVALTHDRLADVRATVLSSGAHLVVFAGGHYGHGGKVAHEHEWRMRPERSGGGGPFNQGMHNRSVGEPDEEAR